MNTAAQIEAYISGQPEAKCNDMLILHESILQLMPNCKLWFLDGKNDEGKVISNPNIGYGHYNIQYADGSGRAFYQIGLSANTTGISVYILGLTDKRYLAENYGATIGKASVTGYCIKFKHLAEIDMEVLKAAMAYGIAQTTRKTGNC